MEKLNNLHELGVFNISIATAHMLSPFTVWLSAQQNLRQKKQGEYGGTITCIKHEFYEPSLEAAFEKLIKAATNMHMAFNLDGVSDAGID